MKKIFQAAMLLAGVTAASLAAAGNNETEHVAGSATAGSATIEEIVVRESQLTTDSASINLENKPVLDSAEALRALPSQVTSNFPSDQIE